ncbi:GNAT family N-acetyltransferase [Staphylococcus nepalensis]|uniref:Ribosomal-protein-alanine acetyltransferase n=2 Tax=Staphylococcus nepalensis TaxID=214473 RepID=A0A380GLG4_9STAP|nr:GNAT family N-acetyltransferase [Staphylococcus nepalensis]GGB84277.1 N-acetyltransferase [Staphylococcus nepalensis]SUM55262.1 ribosomal-protein-alanine acetyltransferase [Staphylococcus nepalensis]VDG67233.1 GNAT family acetyltransferase [Lacrimispora indolis]
MMKYFKLQMLRDQLDHIPDYGLPNGYKIRHFQKGEQLKWANVETSVNEFNTINQALCHFNDEFGPYLDQMEQRCLFIENAKGEVIGTATAWYGRLTDERHTMGRIHWVAIIPEYQGKHLSKPLLSATMKLIAKYHNQVYLTSQTTSYQAINMYLDFGFRPIHLDEHFYEAWSLLEEKLNRTIL